mmetsp:Transcript_81572/g.214132  ORF Transcript_81572/g.214132 Transcript_81572/m.214132 type:complete len:195 (+) Transcript_81572:75-659(+)
MVRASIAITLLASLWASTLFAPALAQDVAEAAEEPDVEEPRAAEDGADDGAGGGVASLMASYQEQRETEDGLDMDEDEDAERTDAEEEEEEAGHETQEDAKEVDMTTDRDDSDHIVAQYAVHEGLDAETKEDAGHDDEAKEALGAAKDEEAAALEEAQASPAEQDGIGLLEEAPKEARAGSLRGSIRDTPREHL